jgi:hypothetical protein
MDRSDSLIQPDPRSAFDPKSIQPADGISPLNPSTFPRAEDDEETRAQSPEFHDVPDPGPNQDGA